MLTASPNRFVPSTITSPTWMPMRNRIVSPAAPSAFSFPMASWTATAHCTASTALAKVGDDAVACGVEDPAAMWGDQPVDDFAAGLQPREGADLVLPHQPAVAGDVGGEDCREFSFDRGHVGSSARLTTTIRWSR